MPIAVPTENTTSSNNGQITVLLREWNQGKDSALEAIAPFIYNELHWLAGHYLRKERGNHTLQPTALVNEAWMRLVDIDSPEFQNRKHFYAIAARLMRQILVDHARQKLAGKRGGGVQDVQLSEHLIASEDTAHEYLMLNDALEKLAQSDARKAQVIELRYFSGLTIEEIAEYLHVSISTVMREQRFAEAWLSRYLGANVNNQQTGRPACRHHQQHAA
jgi:RNA polymerase sigma factor (TIGR02999 family)